MNQSESIASLAEALATAQGEMKTASKDATNPHFKSRYADLASVREASQEALAKNGLSLTQTFAPAEPGFVTLVTRLLHKSGEWMDSWLSLPTGQSTAQAYGSAITYARRYGWSAMLGIVADDDDDGNAASQGTNGVRVQHNAPRFQRNSDPPVYKPEPEIDPLHQRPIVKEPRTESTGTVVDAEMCKKGLISHKNFMQKHGLNPDDRELAIFLLNALDERDGGRKPYWESRKDLAGMDWQRVNRIEMATDAEKVQKLVRTYEESQIGSLDMDVPPAQEPAGIGAFDH